MTTLYFIEFADELDNSAIQGLSNFNQPPDTHLGEPVLIVVNLLHRHANLVGE